MITNEIFSCMIVGFENEPFWIRTLQGWSAELHYESVIGDFVRTISAGKPRLFKIDEILELAFEPPASVPKEEPEYAMPAVHQTQAAPIVPPIPRISVSDILEQAEKQIWLHSFEYVDRRAEIHEMVRSTPLEKEWTRTQNILTTAKKNNALSEKAEYVDTALENLPESYMCIELRQMRGEALAYMKDYANASLQYELAGDYQNAAYYASKCDEHSSEYLIEVFRKWILSEVHLDKKVIASFFSLAYKLHCGRLCAETIQQIDIGAQSDQVKKVIYYGLFLALSRYCTYEQMQASLETGMDRIDQLLKLLLSETSSENYEPEKIIKLKHASEIQGSHAPGNLDWEDDICIGYIITSKAATHGYIGKSPNTKIGCCFQAHSLSGELSSYYAKHHTSLRGLKVVYKINQILNQGTLTDVAVEVQAADNLEEFLKNKNLPLSTSRSLHSSPSAEKNSEEMLALNPDGKTYSGYIIRYLGGYGFINKDPKAKIGVYFHISILDDQLKPIISKLTGIKVNCTLGKNEENLERSEKIVTKLEIAEDLDEFVKQNAVQFLSDQAVQETEIVDDEAVSRALKYKSPTAVVQEFATTNKPLHALAALEKSKDSFSYDKFVKHKIQLLQRTKSSDNELIQLLNYTITTSHDGGYIAHNLYFLGQVQYRCKQYSDVIGTMKQLMRYRKHMKTQTQYTDSIYLMAIAYYMLQDYENSDHYAEELKKIGAHTDEVSRLLDRTFASETNLSDNLEDTDAETPLQFDTEVKITPFIKKLIERFSFGSISLKGIPSDFDPWVSECTIQIAKDYIDRLKTYDNNFEQSNNPNAAIAIAKIQKWLMDQTSGSEKEEVEKSLRGNVSHALQILAINALYKSGLDIRIHLFYRMQQYEMSIRDRKSELFNAYINAHYGVPEMRSFRISSNLKDQNYLLMMSDILLFYSCMENDEGNEHIQKLCKSLNAQNDSIQYREALHQILKTLSTNFNEADKLSILVERGSKSINQWLNSFRTNMRSKAESRQWDEFLKNLDDCINCVFLSDYEKSFIKKVYEIVENMDDAEHNTQTAMKQNLLHQIPNKLDELVDALEDEPTYILYSVFADVLGILKNAALTMLAEVTSHEPNIEPVGNLQINVGLTDSREFLLPLEFQNIPPAIQAKNMTVSVVSKSKGVSLLSAPTNGQNVDEGARYSHSLSFRLDSPNFEQVDITVRIDYSYDEFDNIKQSSERRSKQKQYNFTVNFEEVKKIKNRYQEYAKQQTVKDESMFFGRDLLLQKLYETICIQDDDGKDVLRGGNGIVLYGQRRSGKTSILYHLEKKICDNMKRAIVVEIGSSGKTISDGANDTQDDKQLTEKEIQERNANMTLGSLYQYIVLGIKDYIEDERFDNQFIKELYDRIKEHDQEASTPLFPDRSAFMGANNHQLLFNDFMKRFARIAKSSDPQKGFRIAILIDEFTYFNTAIQRKKLPENFMEIWKGIVSDSFITLIVAGQDNMVEFIEQYVNEFSSFHREWVTFLSKEASYKMVTEPIGEERIAADAAEKLYCVTAGSPFLLMDICSNLVEWMNKNKVLRLSGSLPDDFLAGAYMKNYDFKEDLLEPQYKDTGRLDLTDNIKLVLGLIARSTSKRVSPNLIPWGEFEQYAIIKDDMLEERGISAACMREILNRLIKRQVIELQEGYQNKYRIKIPLCREWILRRGGADYGNA